jgi:nucleotide-binding universal stress UspA family protein
MATPPTPPVDQGNPVKKRPWIGGKRPSTKDGLPPPTLPTPTEGQELTVFTVGASVPQNNIGDGAPSSSASASRSSSRSSVTPPSSRPTTPRRWSSGLLTSSPKNPYHELDNEAAQLIRNALERTSSNNPPGPSTSKPQDGHNSRASGSFGKLTFSSMMGGLSALSLSRVSSIADEKEREKEKEKERERGRTLSSKSTPGRSSSAAPADEEKSRSRSRARSTSPFTFRRKRRESSPVPQPLPLPNSASDVELSETAASVRPRSTAFTDDPDSDFETDGEYTEDEDFPDQDDLFDPVTERNTEQNALVSPTLTALDTEADVDPDPLGEGVNVVVPPEPYFPSTLNSVGGSISSKTGKRNLRRKKTVKHEPPPLQTSRPVFKRDRCTITITQGNPEGKTGDRKQRRYVIASDLSEESRYALEWGIGTVLRDGDQLLIVTVVENESKVDPAIPNSADRALKLRSQQERQGLAYILVRQATGLLQRTKLNVSVACQAWHAKNSRHMLLDIVDYNEPTMLIVGSRGLGQLKGILLGSTSHYLIQKCSVPVMVARRRLKRPPRHSAHLSTHRTHVSLAEAGIDRMAAKVDQDVQVMRDEIERDDHRREDRRSGDIMAAQGSGEMDEVDDELEGEEEGVKVSGD